MNKHQKPNSDLIFLYLQNRLDETARLQVEDRLRADPEWRREHDIQKGMMGVYADAPVYDPPARVWAKIRSEIQRAQVKPLWLIRLEELFPPVQTATVMSGCLLVLLVWHFQSTIQPEFQFVDVSDVNGFSLEVDTYLANHELIQSEPLTQDTLLAFYPQQSDSEEE